MRFFSNKKKMAGLMAIQLSAEGIYAASLAYSDGVRPVVEFVSFYPKADKSLPDQLLRLAKESPAKNFHCSLLLASDEYQLFSLEALNVPVEELKSAMRWRLKDMLDYHIDDATVDVLNVPGDKSSAARTHSQFAVAARNKLIGERQAWFADAKLGLRVIDIPEMAQRNISALLEPEGRGLALLSFDDQGGLLTLTFGAELYLSRRLDIKLLQIQTEADDKKVQAFERITLELQRSLDNFDRQHSFITTAKLVLAPMGQVATELQSYLASNMYMPVEMLNLASLFDFSKIPELEDLARQQSYFMALGAALRREEVEL
ncbi:agglutinin biogenesis protein MshI [Undibacterium sp. Ren11W]|uniref:agglutinin biogenesis protein MshI n=1 Tax=Undibacterium sp. Ren11W TaxID=3413045 RepID=UPI003BF01657